MKAIVIREHGTFETLKVTEHPTPEPGPGEARVRVKACALNHLDTWVRRGVPGHRFPLPLVPGSDVAGILDSGNVEGISIGDEVVVAPFTSCGECNACKSGNDPACASFGILGESRDGGCGEYIVVPSSLVFRKPGNLTMVEAAAVLLAPLTAWRMLFGRAKVKAGENVLVTAAAGGVGSAAVQLAASTGAMVVAVVGTEEKVEPVRALGASEVVVLPRGGDLKAVLKQALGRLAFDVVVDSVGAEVFEAGLKVLKPFGRLVTCGATAGAAPTLDLRRVFFLSQSILGSTMGSREDMAQVLQAAADGRLKPVVSAVLPLERLGEGHRMLEERQVIGKVVVTVD